MTKYHARRAYLDGLAFDSQAEARRYSELKLLEAAGEISGLQVHPEYELQPAFTDRTGKRHRKIVYEADFSYWPREGALVVEDVKGFWTPVARLKVKLFLYRYQKDNIDFRIVT